MMNIAGRGVRTFAAVLGLLGACALGASAELPYVAPPAAGKAAVRTPETVISQWPARPQREARVLIGKYGEPRNFDNDRLVWGNHGPWQQIIVYRKAPRSFLGYHGKDILEQSIAYVVPAAKVSTLARFDNRIRFDKASGRLSARSESENLNYLALNLADEIVKGKRDVDDARGFYRKTASLAESGKSSGYMERLLFIRAGPAKKPAKKASRRGQR
jgi:hypothetical protein